MTLLELVDSLIGPILRGNVYTDTAPYKALILQQTPYELANDPRLLNFGPRNEHPHDGLVGQNTNEAKLYPEAIDQAHPLHDNVGDFLDSTPRTGPVAAQTPAAKRASLYNSAFTPGAPISDVGNQLSDLANFHMQQTPRGDIYNPPPPPPDVAEQYTNMTTNVEWGNPSLKTQDPMSREDIYKNSVHEIVKSSAPTLGDLKGLSGKPPTEIALSQIQSPIAAPEGVAPQRIQGQSPYVQQTREEMYLDYSSRNIPLSPDRKPPVRPLNDLPPTDKLYNNGAGQFNGSRKEIAPIQGQIDSEVYRRGNQYDDGGVKFFERGGGYKLFPAEVGPLKYFDIVATAHWLRGISREVLFTPRRDGEPSNPDKSVGLTTETIGKSAQWLVSQFLLTAFNPGDSAGYGKLNQLWNPLSMPLSAIPLLRSTPLTNITIGAVAGDLAGMFGGAWGYEKNVLDAKDRERLLQMRDGSYKKAVDGNQLSQLRGADAGFVGDMLQPGKTATIEGQSLLAGLFGSVSSLLSQPQSISSQVGKPPTGFQSPTVNHNIYPATDEPGEHYPNKAYNTQQDLEKKVLATGMNGSNIAISNLFRAAAYPGADTFNVAAGKVPVAVQKVFYWKASPDGAAITSLPSAAAAMSLDVAFAGTNNDNADGVIQGFKGQTMPPLSEGEVYLPFMFEDLRYDTPQYLYFRAFIKSGLSEMFSPEWQASRYFGRVDQVPVYMGTNRTLNVSFDVVAWSPSDLNVMWKKLQKLQSMVYPMYDALGFMSRGPIVRMRIGDLICNSQNRGLPGYITSMNWAYDDGIWNMTEDSKVPRKVSVSISFTVLHEGNPGIYPYSKDTITKGISKNAGSSNTPSTPPENVFGAGILNTDANSGDVNVAVAQADVRKVFGPKGGAL